MASTITGSVYLNSMQIGNMMRYRWDLWGDAAESTCLHTNGFSGGIGGAHASDFYMSHINSPPPLPSVPRSGRYDSCSSR